VVRLLGIKGTLGLLIDIRSHVKYGTKAPCNLLLQIEAADGHDQVCEAQDLSLTFDVSWNIIAGEEGMGHRRWGRVEGVFDCTYHAQVRVSREVTDLKALGKQSLLTLPSEVTKFLMPSRYCHPEAFLSFVPEQFGSSAGGRLIADMAAWIAANFTYDNGASDGLTTATDSFHKRRGVCRDYAHVLISMARSVGIPARMASVYAPNVIPQDFHAVAEVYLDGEWHLVDPTAMADPAEIVRIGVGRDAADVSFMTSYGWMELIAQSVDVTRIS